MEIDHIFICTSTNAPEGDLLVEYGLEEGSSNTHPGQGTACRRFYFHNLMIELLWVENIEEVKNERTKPMRFYERCFRTTNAISPFGIIFRPTIEKKETAPFKAWEYHPIYLPDFLKMQVAENTPLSEPLYVYLSFAHRQDNVPIEKREPIEHKVPLKEITSTKIYIKQDSSLSEPSNIINQTQNVTIVRGKEHLIELEFDNGMLNNTKDFRPNLPLIFKW